MSLEQYMFPFGRRNELLKKRNELLKEKERLTKKISRLDRSNHELVRQNWKLGEELYKRHIEVLLPTVEHIVDMSKINVYHDHLHEIERESIGVHVHMPPYKFQTTTTMNYTERAIRRCAEKLSHGLVKHIAFKLRKVYQEQNKE